MQSFEEAGDQLFTFTAFRRAMESAAHHQGARANQRGVPPPDQGPSRAAEPLLLLPFGLLRSR